MDFTIKDQKYSSKKLDAFTQFHIARRLAPLMSGLISVAQGTNVVDVLAPLAKAVSSMSDEDCNYILTRTLSVVARQQGAAWSPVTSPNGKIMFDDIDMPVMMEITVNVIQENLAPFFQDAVGKANQSSAGQPAAA